MRCIGFSVALFGTWDVSERDVPATAVPKNHYLDKWAEQELTSWEKLMAKESLVLPPPVTDEIRSVLDAQGDQLGNEISRCFGIDETGALVRKGSRDGTRVVFRRHVLNGSAPFEHELMVGAREAKFKTTIPEETPIRIKVKEHALKNQRFAPQGSGFYLKSWAKKQRRTASFYL